MRAPVLRISSLPCVPGILWAHDSSVSSQLRLRKSLEFVGESWDDILTTAIVLGYSGHSHFTSAFHRMFGVKPQSFGRCQSDVDWR